MWDGRIRAKIIDTPTHTRACAGFSKLGSHDGFIFLTTDDKPTNVVVGGGA